MTFRKTIEENSLAFAFQNSDPPDLCRELLLFLMNVDNEVYATKVGLTNMLVRLTKIPRRTIERAIKELRDQGFIEKFDEFSCRVNPMFAVRSAKVPDYNGPEPELSKEAKDFVFEANMLRTAAWKEKGKNVIAHKEKETMSPGLKKEFEKLRKQNDSMMDLLKSIAAGLSPAETKEKIECHLKLVKNDE